MSLYPDLSACGIAYMHFSLHVSGGLRTIDKFWADRGHPPDMERLLFSGYSRKGKRHTVWLQWRRSHRECCDVTLGLEARPPSKVCPDRRGNGYKLSEPDLIDFISLIRKDVTGVQARYAFQWDKSLDGVIRLSPRIQPISLTVAVFDDEKRGRRVMNVTYERQGDSWLAIVVPTGYFKIADEPVADTFFKTPYETACLLATSLRQERLEPL